MAHVTLTASGLGTVDLGIVTNVSDSVKYNVSSTKIPTLPAESTFLIDTGSTETVSIAFSRKSGMNGMDNAEWLDELQSFVNRWQAETNGCQVNIIPDAGEASETPQQTFRAYISSLSTTYSSGVPEQITGSISLKVGSLYGTFTTEPIQATQDMTVMISNSEGSKWYYLMNQDTSCIDKYSVYGGMNQPFEYVELTIPRRRLIQFTNSELDGDILAGKNQLLIRAIGKGNFIVTRCKLDDDIYTVSGYSFAEAFRGTATVREYREAYSPYQIILDILGNGVAIGNMSVVYTGDSVVSRFEPHNDVWDGEIDFPQGSNAWYVMQVCALRLNCRIFFHEEKAYIFDTTVFPNSYGLAWDSYINRPISLYGEGTTDPDGGITSPVYLAENVVGSAELGDEGTSQLCTVVTIGYTDNGESKTVTCYAPSDMVTFYGERGQKTIRLPEILNESDARAIGEHYCLYLCEAQTSIGFTLKELDDEGWHKIFEPTTGVRTITSEMDEITIRPGTQSVIKPQMLTVSTFTRMYPEFCAEYWFGILQQNDLTQTVSQIQTAVNNG